MPTHHLPEPTGVRPLADERRLRLQSTYLVMIRAYLRRRQASQLGSPAAGSEAKDA